MNLWKQTWIDFWETPIDTRGYCLMRALIGGLFFISLVQYWQRFDDWIVNSPQVATGVIDLQFIHRSYLSLFHLVEGATASYILFALLCLPVVLFTLGRGGRVSALLTYICFLSLANKNPAVLFGFDEYLGGFLLLFVFYPGMHHYAFKKEAKEPYLSQGLETITVRFFQIVFCFRYFAAGLYKPNFMWSDGTVIWQLLNNYEMQKFDISLFHEYWGVLGWVSWTVKVFEIMFVPLILYRPTRALAIIYGVLMHLGIGLLTPLMMFSSLMMACYLVFLPTSWMDNWDRWRQKVWRQNNA